MGDVLEAAYQGIGRINLENGYFQDMLYVPSLAANLLSVYQMTHIGVAMKVIFTLDNVKIVEISYGKIIAQGIVGHHSKIYEFSHFMSYSTLSALLTHTNEVGRL